MLRALRFSEHPIDRELARLGDTIQVMGAHERRVDVRMARHRPHLLETRPAQERQRDRRVPKAVHSSLFAALDLLRSREKVGVIISLRAFPSTHSCNDKIFSAIVATPFARPCPSGRMREAPS